jgi:hypothetical protein
MMSDRTVVIRDKYLFKVSDPDDCDVLRRIEIIARLLALRDDFYTGTGFEKGIDDFLDLAAMKVGIEERLEMDENEIAQIDKMFEPVDETNVTAINSK